METALKQVSQPGQWIPTTPAVFTDTERGVGVVGAEVGQDSSACGRSKVRSPEPHPGPGPTAGGWGVAPAHHGEHAWSPSVPLLTHTTACPALPSPTRWCRESRDESNSPSSRTGFLHQDSPTISSVPPHASKALCSVSPGAGTMPVSKNVC